MSDDQNQVSEHFPKTQDDLDRIIQKAKSPLQQRITALESENTQITQDRDAAQQQVTERDETIEGLENTVSARDRTILVNQVASEKKVPAKYLTGDSLEDLNASADEFLADVQSLTKKPSQEEEKPGQESGGDGEPDSQKRGHVPSAGTGSEKPPRPTYEEIEQKAYEQAKP